MAGSLLAVLLAGCAAPPPGRERSEWAETTLRRMTLEEKVGQMLMARAYGYYVSSEGEEYKRLLHLVRDRKVGGFVFFQGDVLETASLINRLQASARFPLLMASDYEWGPAMRVRRAARFPEAMALGATRDTALAFAVGKATGEESRAMGIQVDLAPVADVNVNPDNPVINTRSFGEDPRLVASMASAFARGIQAAGAVATAKHFPGHGDTQTDSHLSLPVLPYTRQRMDSVELVPFRRLVADGIGAVMVGHLEVPALQEGRSLPATLSPWIVDTLLRGEMGFTGLVMTDAMEMGALVNGYGGDSAVVKAVDAGDDLILTPQDEDGAIDALVRAVRRGRISEARIETSVRKILDLKWTLGLATGRMVSLNSTASVVASPEHLMLARRVARGSITVLKNDDVLPIGRSQRLRILTVVLADAEQYRTEINRPTNPWSNEPAGDYFLMQLRRRCDNVRFLRVDPSSNAIDFGQVRKAAESADLILCPVYSKARSGSGEFGLPPELSGPIDSLALLGSPLVVIAMGSPYVLGAFPSAAAVLCTYSDCEASTEALVEVLFGEVAAAGKLPVSIPGMFAFGSGIDLPQSVLRRDVPENLGFARDGLNSVDSLLRRAVRDSAFPGGQALVVRNGAIVYERNFGRLEYAASSPQVSSTTMYDLASLTKVIATTSAVMRLYDEGKLHLDDTVASYIPEFANHGKERITVRNLLLHNGGLPPFKRLYATCSSPQQVLDSVYESEMIYRTGDSTVYSDFDFIVLGKIVETIAGTTLDRYVDSVFFAPLGMSSTMFRPSQDLWDDIAPTELDTVYRKALIRGVVHDENAYALGGVSGHAGLFSNARDLAVFMQMLMNGGRRYLNPATVRIFTTKVDDRSSRALGWDTKSPSGYSSAGKLFGPASFGHTGFTGTSIWVDPDRKLFVIFLTNRVFPTRLNMKIAAVRPALHDAIVRALMPDGAR